MSIATTTANGFFGSVMLAWSIAFLGGSVLLLIWALAIWHVMRFPDVPRRRFWQFATIFPPLLGAVIYYFFVLLPYNRSHPFAKPKKQI